LNDMSSELSEHETPSDAARNVAIHALLAGAHCTQARTALLLKTSRRSVGRAATTDVRTALRDDRIVAQVQQLLADSADHGSTAKEREDAETWLTRGRHDDHQVEPVPRRRGRPPKAVTMKAASRAKNGRRHMENGNSWSPTSLEVLQRQQQRILHRTALLEYVLTAEQRNGARLALGDALTELLTDISEAARAIGTILHPVHR
jgi:hypothetical protein